MAIIQPRRWLIKPPPGTQLNRGASVTQGLVCAIPANEGGGGYVTDLVNGALYALSGTWATGPNGPVMSFSAGAGAGIAISDPKIAACQNISIHAVFNVPAWNTGSRNSLLTRGGSVYYSSLDASGFQFSYSYSGGGRLRTSDCGIPSIPAGVWNTVTFGSDVPATAPAPNPYYVYNGRYATSLYGDPGTGTYSALSGSSIIGGDGTDTEGWNGLLSHILIWSRKISPSEAQQLYTDPWCWLSPQTSRRPLIFLTSGVAPSIITGSLPRATQGVSYSGAVAGSGGTSPYTWAVTSGSLPGGLTLGSINGVISGNPSAIGSSTFTIQLTDASSQTATAALSISVAAATLSVTTSSLPSGTVGSSYSQTLVATGGTSPYTWAVTSGSLPGGVSLTSGIISGIPSWATSYTFTVTATDAATPIPQTTSVTLTITIASAITTLAIATATIPDGSAGSPYAQTLTASGGSGGYTWSVLAGTLPAGLVLASNGALTGTPATANVYSFTVQCADAASHAATQAYTVTIAASGDLVITTTPVLGARVSSLYTYAPAALGGKTPYTWSATGLPPGISINPSTGVISGVPTPTTVGTYAVTLQVMESA